MNANKIILASALLLGIAALSACSKSSNSGSSESFTTVESNVIESVVNKTAVPQCADLVSAGTELNANITTLVATPTDANLLAAQASWKKMRITWERCEGFLIGPVESNEYDPNSDTWPTDYRQMDSLLDNSTDLSVAKVETLFFTMRGYHPIEYLLFGEGGTRKVSELNGIKQQYLASLSADLLNNNVKPLYNDWTAAPTNYAQKILTAGTGNTEFSSRQALFLALAGDEGMAGICNEVGQQNANGKMYNPYITEDSTLAESPYSGNSLIDFKNNIVGVQQVYMGINGGKGIKDLVAAKNKDLDNKIQAAIIAAVSSFDNISGTDNMRFEVAITKRRSQIATTMTLLNQLQDLLEGDLETFIRTYVKD